MKTFTLLTVMTLVQFISSLAGAYILPLENILQKNAALAGAGILSVEQDVHFTEAGKTYTVHETWLIEGDRNLRLTARGLGELKDAVNLTYLYNGKNRTQKTGTNRQTKVAGADFYEKFLGIKSKDSYPAYLKELGISEQVRLSRAGGHVCFAVGDMSPSMTQLNPQIWFEQDSFRLAKIRFSSQAEVDFTDYEERNGVHYPKKKQIEFNGQTVSVNVTKFGPSTSSLRDFYPETVEAASILNTSAVGTVGAQVEAFYTRFR